MNEALLTLAGALLLELVVGEPPARIHPVCWMGDLARRILREAPAGPAAELVFGALVAVLVPAVFALPAVLLLDALPGWAQIVVGAYLLKASFAVRALGDAARGVRDALRRDDLPAARFGLRSLCSRDASALGPADLSAATIESVAENTSDSVVAPLFYAVLFGPAGALAYRAINTLDAMIGYHGKYEWLGKCAARLDDVANLIPARLTAFLLLVAGALGGADAREGLRAWWRDARATESPNAGRPMATMAGLLRVELVKHGHYRLGTALEPMGAAKIDAAWDIVRRASALAFLAAAVALVV